MGVKTKRNTVASQSGLVLKSKVAAISKRVLADVKPSEEEIRITTAYSNEIMGRLRAAAPDGVEILFAGSVARGTELRGSSDIDIFLLFPKGTKKEEITRKGLEIGKKIVARRKNESYIIKYAEHPYLRLMLNDMGIKADIVPASKIENHLERVTAVDRTQLHNKFINGHLSMQQKDDVRVLKSFMKSHGIYGAEAKTSGFSGYLCELMVYQFGSFFDSIQAVSKLRLPAVFRPLNRSVSSGNSPECMEAVRKFRKEFVIVDPTDPERNVAAVVSDEALARLIVASRLFLARPSLQAFYGSGYSDAHPERSLAQLRRELGVDIYVVHVSVPDVAEDIVWQQTTRLEGSITSIIERDGFPPLLHFSSVTEGDANIVLFAPRPGTRCRVVSGPSVFMGESPERFITSHKGSFGIFFSGSRLVSLEPIKHEGYSGALAYALSVPGVLPSYLPRKRIKVYLNDMPKDIARAVHSGFIKKTTI